MRKILPSSKYNATTTTYSWPVRRQGPQVVHRIAARAQHTWPDPSPPASVHLPVSHPVRSHGPQENICILSQQQHTERVCFARTPRRSEPTTLSPALGRAVGTARSPSWAVQWRHQVYGEGSAQAPRRAHSCGAPLRVLGASTQALGTLRSRCGLFDQEPGERRSVC